MNCQEYGETFFREDEYNVFFEKRPEIIQRWDKGEGIDIYTKEKVLIPAIDGWYSMIMQYHIEKGDTLIKKKGELKVYIHKKGKVEEIPYECEGTIYQ